MKTGIHPKYEETTIKCACGNEIKTRSTVSPEIHTELCSACHPFYTGKQKFVDAAGRVDKFRARVEAAKTATKAQPKDAQPRTEKSTKDNAEKLTEIKKELNEKPLAVDQAMTSDEELAAEEELKSAA